MAVNRTCELIADDVFGPSVNGCGDVFDFTLLFEQTILSIGPSSLLLIFALLRIVYLLQCSVKTAPTIILPVKVATLLAFLGIQITLLVFWALHPVTRASIASAVLSVADALVILLLSTLEHSRSVRPSTVLSIYLLLSLLFDITTVRTLYLRDENHVIQALSASSLAIKVSLWLLELWNKERFLKSPYNTWSPEALGSIINRSFFWWLNPLLWNGFKKNLSLKDLSVLEKEFLSETLEQKMKDSWSKYSPSGSRYALVYAAAWCLRWPLLMTIFPRLCLIGVNYAQTFLISTAISYIGESEVDKNKGYGIIGATIFVYIGIACFTTQYQHTTYRIITMYRGAMITLLYDRTTKLQAGVYDDLAAITLMSSDVETSASNIESVLDIWAKIVEIAIGVWLLERQLGWVCIVPLVITILSTYGAVKVAGHLGSAQKLWMGAIQKRVGITSSILSAMKSIKMMGLSNHLTKTIQDQRVRELSLSAKFRMLSIRRLLISIMPVMLGPLLTFVVFEIQGAVQGTARLSTVQAYTSLAIISLLTSPAQALLSVLPSVNAALASVERIQAFLLSSSLEDGRIEQKLSNSSSIDQEKVDYAPTVSTIPLDLPIIQVDQACVKASEDSPVVLHDVSFQATRGSLTMIIGTVGAGKSILLKALLGELPCDSGTIQVASKRMAYCSQTPWLRNATIRQIVCGVSSEELCDMNFFEKTLHVCAFDEDVLQFPNSYDTVIGSRGITLSGGQKQRLALARAVYARQDIVLLDDVLSAIDARTEEMILQRLLGKDGLFRHMGSTVILATHAVKHLGQADNIIVLDAAGHVLDQGTFEHLKSQGSLVNSIILAASSAKTNASEERPSEKRTLPKALNGASATDIDDLSRRMGDVTLYRYYFAAIGWQLLASLILTMVVVTLANSAPQIWLKFFTEDKIHSVAVFSTIYALFVIIYLSMTGVSTAIMYVKATPRSGARLHFILLKTVMRAKQSFFDKTDTGITLNRFSQDMTLVDATLPVSLFMTLQALSNCLAMAALISLGSSYMAITILGLVAILYFLQVFYLRTSRQIRFLDLEAKSPLYTNFMETLEGLSTIRAFGWKDQFKNANNQYLDTSQQPYYLLYCIQRWLNLVLQLLIGAMAVLVIGLAVGLRGTTNPSNLGISLTTILYFNTNVQFLLTWWTSLETSLGAVARTKNFEEQTPKEDKPEENNVPDVAWPSKGEIEFCNVSASYSANEPILRNISIKFHSGEKIGICGRTGSGKSTLLYVLLRLLDMESGTIKIDGIDLATVPREIIRGRLVAVPQDPFSLNGTIRLNADPTRTISDGDIIAAMTKVQLWDAIESRGGLDAEMAKQPLSQGQQQLFCIGCALLRRNNKILVLDEATSSMNLETDQLVQKLIRQDFRDYTTVTIAHRLESIMDCDRVVVMERGEIVEVGSPGDLLQREGSEFGKLNKAD